jgi:hypothetical protein
MKIRNGFVSNSSSSSFIIVLPDNFDHTIILDKVDNINTKDKKGLKNAVLSFINDKTCYEYQNQYIQYFSELFEKYIVEIVDGQPDDGRFIILDNDIIRSIIG